MTAQQPKALWLADAIERYNAGVHSQAIVEDYSKAAAELRRLHALNVELLEALRRIADTSANKSGNGSPWVHWVDQARAAIAKADGEKSWAFKSKTSCR